MSAVERQAYKRPPSVTGALPDADAPAGSEPRDQIRAKILAAIQAMIAIFKTPETTKIDIPRSITIRPKA
jgi:hypothetical protein